MLRHVSISAVRSGDTPAEERRSFARTPPEFLQPGDVVECAIEGIGGIRNRIVSA